MDNLFRKTKLRASTPTHMNTGTTKFNEAHSFIREEGTKSGVIRSILTIGEDMYAVVEDTSTGKIMGYHGEDPTQAILPEVLIPVDRSAKSLDGIPQELIGMQVEVVFGSRGKYPKYVILKDSIAGVRGEPFRVSTEHIFRARANGDGDINAAGATDVLKEYGYTDEEISALRSMQLDDLNWEGNFINFSGDAPTPWTTHQSQIKGQETLSLEAASLVKNPPAGKLKRKNCYLPPKAFTGK